MRTELGIAGVSLLFVAAGLGVLLAVGLVQMRLRTLLAASGLAYLVGAASTVLIGIVLVVVGGELNLPLFVVLALLLGGGGAFLAWRRRPAVDPTHQSAVEAAGSAPMRSHKVLIVVASALLVALLVVGLVDAGVRPLSDWDSWSIWTRKAVVLTSSGLDAQVFAGIPYSFMHQEYPVFLPLFESVYFRAMGGVDEQAVHALIWLMFVACLGSIAYLGSRFTRIWVWFPVVLALAFGTQFHSQLLTAYADVPMGLLAAPAVLCLGLWLRELDWRFLAVGALLLAAVASVKNEGLLLMVVTLAAAAVVLAAGRDWTLLRRLGLAAVGIAVALAPWRIWVSAHDIKSNLPIAKGLDPSYLSDHSDRVSPTLKALIPMLESGGLSYIVPIALALAILAVATRSLRRVAAFYLLAGLGTFASVVWAFVIAPGAIDWQIGTAGNRVIMGVTFVSLAGLLHLAGLLDRHGAAGDEEAAAPVGEPAHSDPATPARQSVPA
jgi:hypothetical protein